MSPKYILNSSMLTFAFTLINIFVFSIHVNKHCITDILALMDFLNLSRALQTCFIFVKLSFLLSLKFIKIYLGSRKFLVKSTTIFLSFLVNLPTRRWSSNFRSIRWLCIPLKIFNGHSFVLFK